MLHLLNEQQKEIREQAREFVQSKVLPFAANIDRQEQLPDGLFEQLADQKLLGAVIPESWGGSGMEMVSLGLIFEEIGHASAAIASLLTVHCMISQALLKWGNDDQKNQFLPAMAQGKKIGAYALTEPDVGSDAKHVQATAQLDGDDYVLNGRKKWITSGQIADLFLVFAQSEDKSCAFLVPREAPGFRTEPIHNMLGFRGNMLAECIFDDCRIPRSSLIGRMGFGFSHVVSSTLDLGRYTVAWSGIGLARACLESSISYASNRQQFGQKLREHQLIQEMLADMASNLEAARLLCFQAGSLKDNGDPRSIMQTIVAKYFSATTAAKAARDAVQLHGANGVCSEYPVERYLRDAKILEIIEGSNQMLQSIIARHGLSPSGAIR